MRITHAAPRAPSGVTTMMSVGDDGGPSTVPDERLCAAYDERVNAATWVALAVWFIGAATGSKALQHIGAGAGLALLAVRHENTAEDSNVPAWSKP